MNSGMNLTIVLRNILIMMIPRVSIVPSILLDSINLPMSYVAEAEVPTSSMQREMMTMIMTAIDTSNLLLPNVNMRNLVESRGKLLKLCMRHDNIDNLAAQ